MVYKLNKNRNLVRDSSENSITYKHLVIEDVMDINIRFDYCGRQNVRTNRGQPFEEFTQTFPQINSKSNHIIDVQNS